MLKKKKVAWISNRTPWCIHRAPVGAYKMNYVHNYAQYLIFPYSTKTQSAQLN